MRGGDLRIPIGGGTRDRLVKGFNGTSGTRWDAFNGATLVESAAACPKYRLHTCTPETLARTGKML